MEKQNLGDTTPSPQEAVIESLIGLLVPLSPWSGRLVAASAKAVSILHPDGALVSVVGRPSDMESRSMMPPAGFSDFAARTAGVLENLWLQHTSDTASPAGSSSSGGQIQAVEPLQAYWDGQRLSVILGLPATSAVSAASFMSAGSAGLARGSGPVLDFGWKPAVWDPRGRLTGVAQRFLTVDAPDDNIMHDRGSVDEAAGAGFVATELGAAESVAAELRALLAEVYAAGRRAEGLHGTGAFAVGFRRLEAHPDFPAVAVGFGPGTTPAGDDWLAGCLVALDLRAGGPGAAAALLRQKIRDRLEQTTAAGKALLLGALAGAPPDYLVGLAEAAAGQAQGLAGLRSAVANCLEHGATSGEDALAGFVYGLGADEKLAASERFCRC
jgi:hypothetical protein